MVNDILFARWNRLLCRWWSGGVSDTEKKKRNKQKTERWEEESEIIVFSSSAMSSTIPPRLKHDSKIVSCLLGRAEPRTLPKNNNVVGNSVSHGASKRFKKSHHKKSRAEKQDSKSSAFASSCYKLERRYNWQSSLPKQQPRNKARVHKCIKTIDSLNPEFAINK